MNVSFQTSSVQKHGAQIQGRLQIKHLFAIANRCPCFAQSPIYYLPHLFFRQPGCITLDCAFGRHLYPIKLPDLAEPLQQRTISHPRREITEASPQQRASNRTSQCPDRMFLESCLLLSTYEIFEPDHTAFAFARELYLFDLALA